MRVSIRNNKGFSLVELMVVVAIIGILAAIAVPNFQRFTAKSKQSEAKANLSAVYASERGFFSEWSLYAGDFAFNGYAPTGNLRYSHGFSAVVTDPTTIAGFPLTASGEIDTNAYCAGAGAGTCQHVTVPVDATGAAIPGGGVTAATTFEAGAVGDIDGDATFDEWTINEAKTFVNTNDDLTN